MKVVTSKQMAELEAKAYQEGYSEEAFMENAGRGVALNVFNYIKTNQIPKHILLLCGKGNNGGDAFVAGTHLLSYGYAVSAISLDNISDCSPLCQKNRKRFLEHGGVLFSEVITDFSSYGIILDGLFGTGFKGEVKKPYSLLIEEVNKSQRPIISIDIPSGLDGSSGEVGQYVIQATETLFLGLPKTGFFLLNGWNYVGKLKHVDFGLPQDLIDNIEVDFDLLMQDDVKNYLPSIKRNRHKYQAGEVIGLSGSTGMPGASLLAALAALRGGAGIVRLLHPKGTEAELSNSPYELIKIGYEFNEIEKLLALFQKGAASFIGPGIGVNESIGNLLEALMPKLQKPCVVDADALTLYSQKPFKLPKNAIFTPHTGEMQRLLNQKDPIKLTVETLKTCQKFAEEKQITLILKGAPTFIFHPGKLPCVNPTGDPGMATAGSGDVLTGLLAALLAQGLTSEHAAQLGVYLHGLAGEFAAKELTSYCMLAGDIIKYFPHAIKTLK